MFGKLLREIHSIAHLWAEGSVVDQLRWYPDRAKKILSLSDTCEGLFSQDRSILACKQLEITLADCWPFSVVTNFAPSKRLIVKEMLQDNRNGSESYTPDDVSEEKPLRYKFLDAIYEEKIPQGIDIIFEFSHDEHATEFCDELAKRSQSSTVQDIKFKVRSPRAIPDMLLENNYGKLEIKSSPPPQAGQVQYTLCRYRYGATWVQYFEYSIEQRSFSLVLGSPV